MTDPYKVLGVSRDADDKEIKAAYKKLVRKYHPDKYQDEDMARLANEKMTEINAAYDQITDERKNGGASNSYTSYSSYSSYGGNSQGSRYSGSAVDYREVRRKLQMGNISEASSILSAVPQSQRTAEWYFLWGTVCYQRGWLNEAYSNISRAAQMDPYNSEYAAALNQMNRNRNGHMNGYSRYNTGNSANNTCNCMSDLCLADCCCEMLGGDLIPCC